MIGIRHRPLQHRRAILTPRGLKIEILRVMERIERSLLGLEVNVAVSIVRCLRFHHHLAGVVNSRNQQRKSIFRWLAFCCDILVFRTITGLFYHRTQAKFLTCCVRHHHVIVPDIRACRHEDRVTDVNVRHRRQRDGTSTHLAVIQFCSPSHLTIDIERCILASKLRRIEPVELSQTANPARWFLHHEDRT